MDVVHYTKADKILEGTLTIFLELQLVVVEIEMIMKHQHHE